MLNEGPISTFLPSGTGLLSRKYLIKEQEAKSPANLLPGFLLAVPIRIFRI
jgi:hypothetical protein